MPDLCECRHEKRNHSREGSCAMGGCSCAGFRLGYVHRSMCACTCLDERTNTDGTVRPLHMDHCILVRG